MTYKALVVEEDAEVLAHIEEAMASLEHLWDVVASQEEALKRLKANEYAYMLLASQIRARCGNGCRRPQNTENLLEKMAELPVKSLPRVILMSDIAAEGVEETVEAMLQAIRMSRRGVVNIIPKPFPSKGRISLDYIIKKATTGDVQHTSVTWPVRAPAKPAAPAKDETDEENWLTVTEAAKLLAHDLPGLTIKKSRSRISTGAGRDEFRTTGSRRDRRIDPVSFAAWRLKQRDRDLDEEDDMEDR